MDPSYQKSSDVIKEVTKINDTRELIADLTARLADITPKGSQFEFRSFSDKERGPAHKHWLPVNANVSQINAAVEWCEREALDGRGVFIGYNPRRDAASGEKENVVENPMAFYVDLDIYKLDGVSQQDVLVRLGELPSPTYLVNSGGGLQAVWIAEPQESYEKWVETQELLYNEFKDLGSDRSIVTDTARVLRVPGLPNQKLEQPRRTSLVNGTPLDIQPVRSSLLRKALAARKNTDEETLIASIIKPKLVMPEEAAEHGTAEHEEHARARAV